MKVIMELSQHPKSSFTRALPITESKDSPNSEGGKATSTATMRSHSTKGKL